MTDHADTIRAQISAALDTFGAGGTLRQAVEDRLDALLADVLAERRQAAQEIKRQMERNRLLRDERDSLGEQRQQAIDALRLAYKLLESDSPYERRIPWVRQAWNQIDAALVKLGEKP